MASRDIIILGAGHNALVTAFYLAGAGHKPLVLERREQVGGAAVSEEFHPGFRVSALAHKVGPLRPEIVRDMQLARHGLEMIAPDPVVVSLTPDGRSLALHADTSRAAREIEKFSAKDAFQYTEFARLLKRLAPVLSELLSITPPDIDEPARGELPRLLKAALGLKRLGDKDMFRLLRWGPMAVADLVAEWFETELLRATVAARGVFGTAYGPWSAGSSAVLLLHAAADPHPAGVTTFPRGGMGALTSAMAAAATRAGAEIRTGAEVTQILVKNGAASGVVLAGGEEIAARCVISGADPKRTLLGLVDPSHLKPNFVVKMRNYRAIGNVAKVNLALAALPEFTALKDSEEIAPAGRIHIGPEIDYLERAFDCSKYGEFSEHPHLEVLIPTLSDPSLAPAGKHVMSVYVQYAPYKLRQGDWKKRRDELGDRVLATLAEYAPHLPQTVVAREVITPLDLEEKYGLTGGHIFHGELALDQLFTMRPLLGWARYQTPVEGLYLCGSGTHPGNGLTGGSGANAARAITKHLRRQR